MNAETVRSFEFNEFQVDVRKRLLLLKGEPVALPPRAFDVLLALIQNRDRVVRKDDLMRLVWPDVVVEEGNLTQNIFLLRKALGDKPHDHRFIVTLPGQGYRFVGEVAGPVPRAGPIEPGGSITVLPFRTLSSDAGDEIIAMAIVDALTTRLAQERTLAIKACGPASNFQETGWDPVCAGRQIGVDAVVCGTIQRSRETVRVTVQVLSAQYGHLVWAEIFEDDAGSLFGLQDRISNSVRLALAGSQPSFETAQPSRRHTENAEAYQSYLKGRFFWNKRTSEGFGKAIEHFKRACAIDPKYALAHAGIANCYNLMAAYSVALPRELWPLAQEAATRALELDGQQAETHAALAIIAMVCTREWAKAEKCCLRALELDPNCLSALNYYSEFLTAMGRHDEAVSIVEKARGLDPISSIINRDVGCHLYFARRYDEAIEQLRDTIEMDPGFALAHWSLGRAYERKGMYEECAATLGHALALSGNSNQVLADLGHAYGLAGKVAEARAVLDQLAAIAPLRYVSPYENAMVWLGLGELDRALNCLEEAVEHCQLDMIYVNVESQLDPLRGEARFRALVQRVGLGRD